MHDDGSFLLREDRWWELCCLVGLLGMMFGFEGVEWNGGFLKGGDVV